MKEESGDVGFQLNSRDWITLLIVHQREENSLLDRGEEPRERPDCQKCGSQGPESMHETGLPAASDRRIPSLPLSDHE